MLKKTVPSEVSGVTNKPRRRNKIRDCCFSPWRRRDRRWGVISSILLAGMDEALHEMSMPFISHHRRAEKAAVIHSPSSE